MVIAEGSQIRRTEADDIGIDLNQLKGRRPSPARHRRVNDRRSTPLVVRSEIQI